MPDEKPVAFTKASAIKIADVVHRVLGQGRGEAPIAKRTRHPQGGTSSGGGVLVVLIDEDIEGVEEDDSGVIEGAGPGGEDIQLWLYERRELDLKYFRAARSDDPGYDADKKQMVLATKATPDNPDDPDGIEYDTKTVLYDDGDDFEVDRYGRDDFPDYDGDEWPPEGVSADDLNRRYRGECVKDSNGNWVLVTIFCPPLPPPTLESLGYVAPEE